MTNMEIEAIIKKYQLVRNGDKIGTYKKGVNAVEFRQEVGGHKDEIMDYMIAQEKEKAERIARRHETFEAIPGVKEIRAAREANINWKKEFNRMMETGDSVMRPGYVHHSQEEMAELEARYPQAVKALEIEYRASVTQNLEMLSIYTKAYDAIQDGGDVDRVNATMEAELKAYTDRHIWD